MPAGVYDIPLARPIEQGTYRVLRFAVPYDATGYAYRSAIRDKFGPTGRVLAEAVCTILSTSPTESWVGVEWYAPVTAAIPHTFNAADGVLEARWRYDVEEIPPAGENYARRLFGGTVPVSPEATTTATRAESTNG